MTSKDQLIVKQQFEIEKLKETIDSYKNACSEARKQLIYCEQWSIKCSDFPKVAMSGIVRAALSIEDI